MISVGLVSGPESSALEVQCRRIMKRFEKARVGKSEAGLVNVVFHSPLALIRADHEGLAIGAFSRQSKKVVVAVSVPEGLIASSDGELARYLQESLHQAADHGIEYMKSRHVKVGMESVHAFIDAVCQEEE